MGGGKREVTMYDQPNKNWGVDGGFTVALNDDEILWLLVIAILIITTV